MTGRDEHREEAALAASDPTTDPFYRCLDLRRLRRRGTAWNRQLRGV